jgi:AcrR family transcriptional regulator
MPRSPEPARRQILDAALALFAVQGIGATSLREIRLASGQRNIGALHYHFTDKRGLLEALLERELPVLVERRRELLGDAADLWSIAAVFVLPYAELATGSDHDREVVQFFSQILDDVSFTIADIAALIGDTGTGDATERLRSQLAVLDEDLFWSRLEIGLTSFLHAAAIRARGERRHVIGEDVFRRDLVAMFVGALVAPAHPGGPVAT